jgi:alkyldihydroxyacetonephosphate synthase
VREALAEQGTPPIVLCHISHAYPSGGSLYFTIGCAQSEDPVRQWRAAKAAAGEAIVACGATISHHHGVGADHRALYRSEVGSLGVEAARAVKAVLDPAGIMNPGVIFERS